MENYYPCSKEKLRSLQLQELDLLLKFDNMCKKYSLRYYFTGGTLLGAVRHSGFIPWDDDIDILMPRKDFNRFADLCLAEQNDEFVYVSAATDKDYPHYFAKLRSCTKNDISNGFIDIFPMDVCPDQENLARLFFKSTELCNTALFMRTKKGFICEYTRWYMRFLCMVLCRCPNRFLVCLRNFFRKLFGQFSSGKRFCNVGGRWKFPGEVYQATWFERPTEMIFEGYLFPVPYGWHDMLKNMYGDYMTPPKEAERIGHSSFS